MTIAIVDAGTGNLRSVEKALATVGGDVVVTSDADVVRRADKVVVPGQGAFKDCMVGLSRGGLDEAVRDAIRRGVPFFGMCLGLQILFDESEEHGPVRGLGILPGRVRRFREDLLDDSGARVKVPHMGWNQVRGRGDPLMPEPDGRWFYFVHSYYAVPADPAVTALSASYAGVDFCAAARWQNVFATQFHPEKSQAEGLRLLGAFVRS